MAFVATRDFRSNENHINQLDLGVVRIASIILNSFRRSSDRAAFRFLWFILKTADQFAVAENGDRLYVERWYFVVVSRFHLFFCFYNFHEKWCLVKMLLLCKIVKFC